MKLALIAPVPNLRDFEHDGIHMCLPQLFNIPGYIEYYKERSEAGDFIILDNGAHEGQTIGVIRLLELARTIGAQEIVLPDSPENAEATVAQVHAALDTLTTPSGKALYRSAGSPRLMIVPHTGLSGNQSQVIDELDAVTHHLVRALWHFAPEVEHTIGIPRLYDDPNQGGDYYGIVWCLDDIAYNHGLGVHLLGWPRNLSLPRTIARDDFWKVRSIDAAKPIVYGRHCIHVRDLLTGRPYPGRPDNYFTSPLTEEELHYARHNITSFREALHAPISS